MRAISVRIPEWLIEALDLEAEHQRRTRSQMIVYLLSEALDVRRVKRAKKPSSS